VPVQVSYPGVYVQEVPSGVHSIVGVSTSATAFVDVFQRGPVNQPVRVNGMADFERTFGGLWPLSEASYAIGSYFLNGGETAWVVRVAPPDGPDRAVAATPKSASKTAPLTLEAANVGAWGNNVEVAVQTNPKGAINAKEGTINVAVREIQKLSNGKTRIHDNEAYDNLTTDPGPKNVQDVINDQSSLITVTAVAPKEGGESDNKDAGAALTERVTSSAIVNNLHPDPDKKYFVSLHEGKDGLDTNPAAAIQTLLLGDRGDDQQAPSGIYALDLMAPEIFNLLCLPATAQITDKDTRKNIETAAARYCEKHRAFYLVDCPVDSTVKGMTDLEVELTELGANAAVFFPALTVPDPLNGNRPRPVGPSGTIAGVTARTDTARGMWKAAAGTEATLRGATPAFGVSDPDNGVLNELGINVLRTFPIYGSVSWGARTLDGADAKESQWKYIPVRRLALHIENSLFAGTKWAVFEPNDEPLWGQLRLSVGSFMHDLFRQGAFAGTSPSEAYFVHCDRTTTTPSDIDNGIVNIVVGFAPLKPAEFVIISIQQIAQG
jgi:Bacteriophage tail sheath protein